MLKLLMVSANKEAFFDFAQELVMQKEVDLLWADSGQKAPDIITFCKISLRGYEAQRILNAAGLNRVCFIEGGVVGWPF